VPTDVFRWQRETISVTAATSLGQLRQMCHERLTQRLEREPDVTHLVVWTIQGEGPLCRGTPQAGAWNELLDELQTAFGYRDPAAWSVAIEAEPSPAGAGGGRSDGLVGEMLRLIEQYESHPQLAIELERYLGTPIPDELREVARIGDGPGRERLLRQVRRLVAALPGGGERPSPAVHKLDA